MRDNWPLLVMIALVVFMVGMGMAMDGQDIERPLNQHRTRWEVESPP